MTSFKVLSMNMAFGVNGKVSLHGTDSPTEFKTAETESQHDALRQIQNDFKFENYPNFQKALLTALSLEHISTEAKDHVRGFLDVAMDYVTDEHLNEDNKSGHNRPTAFGKHPQMSNAAETLYNLLLSVEGTKLYVGRAAGLYVHDFIGAWLHSTEGANPRQYLEQIIEMSPFKLSSVEKLEVLLNIAEQNDTTYLLVQEYHCNETLDDVASKRGWQFIRADMSTAFGWRTSNVTSGAVPKALEIITPSDYYQSGSIVFSNPKDIDGLNRSTSPRTLAVLVGDLKFVVIHWKQPKEEDARLFQAKYLAYLTDLGFIVAGDTNCSSEHIETLKTVLGDRLVGDYSKETTIKRRTDVQGTHGQVCDERKANVWVRDPKMQILVPDGVVYKDVEIVQGGVAPLSTDHPTDHLCKSVTIFRSVP